MLGCYGTQTKNKNNLVLNGNCGDYVKNFIVLLWRFVTGKRCQ